MNNTFLYGCHVSLMDDIIKAAKNIKARGGNLVQIMLSNPVTFKMKKINQNEINNISNYLKKEKIRIVIHSPYALNFSRNINHNSYGIQVFIKELKVLSELNGIGCVIHMTVSKEITVADIYNNIYNNLIYVLDSTPENSIILLETSAGQGNNMFADIKNLSLFYDMFPTKYKQRIKICIDTCHVHVAGYDLSDKLKVDSFFDLFDKLIGIKNIGLIHLNDSVNPTGSHIDRHANIGEGTIGKKGIEEVIRIAYKNLIPILLETPLLKNTEEILLIKEIIKK